MEINLDEIFRRFARLHPRIMNWPISRMNDSETKERGLWGVKIQKIPGGVYLQFPLEACIFSAHFGNQSVFIPDPRLLNEVIILEVLETEQFAVSHMFNVFEEQYHTCPILGRRFFILCDRFFPLVPQSISCSSSPPLLSSQESIYANSPRYSTDLLLSCTGHKISQIKWAFELFFASV